MNNVAIGVPQYGSAKKKTWRLKDGSNVYRILPPFGSFAADGRWAVYESIHWGYKGNKGIRTFNCNQVKDFRTKIVKVACDECNLIGQRKAEYEAQLKDLVEVKKTMTKDQAKEFLKPVSSWLYDHNLDKKWYVNAINTQGEIGRLAIPHKMYQDLQVTIQNLIKKGLDPIAANKGVWLDFVRTGTSNATVHKCNPVMETVDMQGQQFEKVKVAPLTEDVLKRMATEAWDLKGMFRTLKVEEVARLVAGGGDPEVVDSVFSTESAPAPEGGSDVEPSPEELAQSSVVNLAKVAPAVVEVKAEVKPVEVKVEVKPVETKDDEIAQLKAKLAALELPKADKQVAMPSGISNDDFMAKFGPKKK